MSTQDIIKSWESGVEPYNATAHRGTQAERHNRYLNRQVQKRLGSAYSFADELYYFGNPLSDNWQTPYERKILNAIERSWQEAIST